MNGSGKIFMTNPPTKPRKTCASAAGGTPDSVAATTVWPRATSVFQGTAASVGSKPSSGSGIRMRAGRPEKECCTKRFQFCEGGRSSDPWVVIFRTTPDD